MADDTSAKPSRLKRAARVYGYVSDILTPQRIGLLLGAAVLAVVGVFGGWSAVSDSVEDVTAFEAGETATATPFEVTPTRARVFDELPGALYAEDGYRYIAVVLDAVNTSAEPVSSYILAQGAAINVAGLRTIELAEGPRPVDARVVRTSDALTQHTFQPGLAANAILVWQQETSEPIPAEVTVTFSDHTWRRSTLDGVMGWRDPAPSIRVVLPLDPLEEP